MAPSIQALPELLMEDADSSIPYFDDRMLNPALPGTYRFQEAELGEVSERPQKIQMELSYSLVMSEPTAVSGRTISCITASTTCADKGSRMID